MTDVPHGDADTGLDEDDDASAGGIGVGMGGSCPECRAPVQLGQEFCLECGSAIRFTGRRRQRQRGGESAAGRAVGTPGPPRDPRPRNGFPWIPFAIVLLLVLGGVGFALAGDDGDDAGDTRSNTTEPALPSITNSTPSSTTATETVPDCGTGADSGLSGAQPPILDPDAAAAIPGEAGTSGTVPQITPQEQIGGDPAATTPTTTPDATDDGRGSDTVTVDDQGNLCGDATDPALGSEDSLADPSGTTPTATTPTTSTSSTTTQATTPVDSTSTTADGSWPTDRSGWTVVVNGDAGSQVRANQISASVQAKGLDAGVLESDDFTSLCPGNWVVFSGVFTTQSQAAGHRSKVEAAGFRQSYVREVRTSGSPASCD